MQQVLDFVLCRFVPLGGGRMEGDENKTKQNKNKITNKKSDLGWPRGEKLFFKINKLNWATRWLGV